MNEWDPAGTSNWEKLTPEQQKDLLALRDRLRRHILAELEAFYVYHPEIQLTFRFECEAVVKNEHIKIA